MFSGKGIVNEEADYCSIFDSAGFIRPVYIRMLPWRFFGMAGAWTLPRLLTLEVKSLSSGRFTVPATPEW